MFAEWLYRSLMNSKRFHYYVRVIHATVNNLPPPPPPGFKPRRAATSSSQWNYTSYKPTVREKVRAYFYIWKDEMKNTFLFRK